jgi:hypothetical protein
LQPTPGRLYGFACHYVSTGGPVLLNFAFGIIGRAVAIMSLERQLH